MTTEPIDALMPCPFCGGDAHIVDDLVVALVECGLCGATSATRSYHAGAIEAWNRRTPQPAAREPLTDENVEAVMRKSVGYGLSPSRDDLELARAIERAHGIGIKGGQHGTE